MRAHVTGRDGEAAAAAFLLAHGYTILARNYRFGRAEIDIVAQKGNLCCMVEVKTRTNVYVGMPQDFVSKNQRRMLRLAADHFVTSGNADLEIRFDIIAIHLERNLCHIEHLKNAFQDF